MRSNISSVPRAPGHPPTPGVLTEGAGESAPIPISLREDHHGIIPYAGEPKLALYQIERELSELLDMRTLAEEEGALPTELEAIDKAIQEYIFRECKKVDGIVHALTVFADAEDAARREANRLVERANAHRAQFDRIKAATLRAMQDHGVRVLETPTNKLRVQANGGKEPLEVKELDSLPQHFRNVVVTLPENIWIEMMELADASDDTERFRAIRRYSNAAKAEADNDAIRAALKQQVPCPECAGVGQSVSGSQPQLDACLRCEGRGTIPAIVPGAKLLPRGFHLRIE